MMVLQTEGRVSDYLNIEDVLRTFRLWLSGNCVGLAFQKGGGLAVKRYQMLLRPL
jgi:hypothetical protein